MTAALRSLAAGAALLFTGYAFAGVDTATDANDVILAGHDAVAYFTQSAPVLGSAEFTAEHGGAIYRFSSAQNRDLFNADPSKYAPAYGGYCAMGAAFGKKFDGDGKAFEIVDGQLFVNKNQQVYEAWQKDIPANIDKADQQWPEIEDVAAGEL